MTDPDPYDEPLLAEFARAFGRDFRAEALDRDHQADTARRALTGRMGLSREGFAVRRAAEVRA